MNTLARLFVAALVFLTAAVAQAADKPKVVYPAAVLPFGERGTEMKDAGAKVTQLLFANLAANDDLVLVEREDVDKLLAELHLSATGVVKPDEAVKIGQLTGARLLIAGSVIQVDHTLYLVAKIIGVETSRVAGASVKGPSDGDLGALTEKLAAEIGRKIKEKAAGLMPAVHTPQDVVAELKKRLGGARLPAVLVQLPERHIGQPAVDPAAQTELTRLLLAAGFSVIDEKAGNRDKVAVLLEGEGFTELGPRIGNLVSVKARLEIKAVDRAGGKVLAAERQTAVVVDATEQIAAKAALADATAQIALRLLPKLVLGDKK